MEYIFHLDRLYSAVHLTKVQYSKVSKTWSYPNHRHSFFEFLYCTKGNLIQWVNGKKYSLASGNAMIIKSDLYHHTEALQDSEFFDFHFDIERPEVHSIFQTMINPIIMDEKTNSEVIEKFNQWANNILQQFEAHFNDKNQKNLPPQQRIPAAMKELQIQTSVLQFITFLAQEALTREQKEYETTQPSTSYIAHKVAYLLEYYSDKNISIQVMAEKLNVHRTHIHNCFKKVYGVSPKTYLSQLRMKSAKQLLLESELTVEQIAEQLSFSSPSHFIRFFAANAGMSPTNYKKRAKQ
ncbi:helix-turn-helix domain-containing protein [Salibacterium aidingense]|uniref:helix-turn-helix domain-containing protein n=1 Tax=Salibacterium aidingense TaxID=384933 RepID=UPI0004200241|nr:AraC family transcriptional regulator [Salibacterium aidingense]